MSELLFGYNTNGFAHHRLEDALAILGELGYRGVALTLDHHVLETPGLYWHINRFQSAVIETGARFLLDSRRKHQPTLIGPTPTERETRFEFLCEAVDLAADTSTKLISFWSGTPTDDAPPHVLMDRLVDGCRRLCDFADSREGVRLAFEPEPGMFIDTMDKFAELLEKVNHPAFGLTLDLGHLHCQGEVPMEPHIRRWKDVLWNVHIEDMRRDVHDHLMFGEGEIDFPPVLRCLKEIGYAGGVHVELSRHSHDAVETARKALAFLQAACGFAR